MTERTSSTSEPNTGDTLPPNPDNSNEPAIVCSICNKRYHQYVCPRCNIPYCSLHCYKSERHLFCSEKFYEREFCESLKNTKISRHGREKIQEVLRKVDDHQVSDESIDTEGEEILREALQDLENGVDPEAILEVLNDKQKAEFGELATGSNVELSLIETSRPWWIDTSLEHLERNELKLPDNCVSSRDNVYEQSKPQISRHIKKKLEELENLPDVSLSIGSCKSPELLLNNVIEIVSSYVYCYIFVGTEFINARRDAVEIIQSLSSVLCVNSSVKYNSPLKAWQGFLDNLKVYERRITPCENVVAILANVIMIIVCKKKVLRILKDIWTLLWIVVKTKSPDSSLLKVLAMKIQFYYGLYRDCRDTDKWARVASDILKIRQAELTGKTSNSEH